MNKGVLLDALNNYYFFYNGESFLENYTIYHIVNQRLLSLRSEGLDLQYKIHTNENRTFIELAFTVFQYWKTCNDKEFVDRVKKHYSDEVTKKILDIRKKIKDNFENQCIQTCINIKTELDRLPKLSKIYMDNEAISIIGLTIPYVNE